MLKFEWFLYKPPYTEVCIKTIQTLGEFIENSQKLAKRKLGGRRTKVLLA
jgi:hypothetical protein